MTAAPARIGAASREAMAQWTSEVHDAVTAMFERLDGSRFEEASWQRKGGGGGQARLLAEGKVFEKAGVNRALVEGILPPDAAARLGGKIPAGTTPHFFATGVSVVAHPRSPMVPTVHLNVRYFELMDEHGNITDTWFGGGTDLTPFYPRYKAWCDEYFVNVHRDNEARGAGGVFFDHVRPGADDHGLDVTALQAFVSDIGRVLRDAYGPLVERRRNEPYGERERDFQLWRRGRYVEFNLVHDRGTTFGLQTNARIESVLMSLPPLAGWKYAPTFEAGTFEADLLDMLRPQEWAASGDETG